MQLLRSIVVLSISALVSTLVVGVGSPARAATTRGEYRSAAVKTVNHIRANRELRKLSRGDCLDAYAQQQARRMARKQTVYHQVLQTVQADCGMAYVGEAIAAGFKTGTGSVKNGLMESAPHKAILLDRASRRIGVGAKKARGGGWYLCVLVGHR